MNSTESVLWDGQIHSYRPAPDWRDRVSERLVLHDEEDDALDPVTYEVIRHRLWTINTGHGDMVTRISGSPVFQALDFNMCILTEDGEVVMNAPYLQYLDSGAPLIVPYILEHHSEDPGVEDGDIYVCNDPWIGAVHQMDVFFGMPVFVEGSLFAWVSNAGHQYDLGGIAAGGWPAKAVDVYHDPVVFPPFKLVEKGHMRSDLEATYLRHSRFPGLVALDLRAQIAGCRFAADQLLQTCHEFGPSGVKAAMRRVLSTAQEAFRSKLMRIPDGRWTEVMYFDEPMPGDRRTQRVQINIDKVGDRLRVDNQGTQEQEASPNGMTYAALTGTVLGALTLTMLQDQLFALGGAARQVDFELQPGLLTCVDHPAPVSAGVGNAAAVLHRVMALLARMLACDPEQSRDAVLPGVEVGLAVISGEDDRGRAFGTAFIEQPGGCGATSWRDGVDTGGYLYAPQLSYPNVEENESFFPVVILWREQLIDSGAAGEWRGGGGVHFGAMEYRSARVTLSTNTAAMAVSGYGATSAMGGYPLPTIEYRLARDTDIYEVFKSHHVPTKIEDVTAKEVRVLGGKASDILLERGDVFSVRYPGGGSYGDPIRREPDRVAHDVGQGWVSVEVATNIYGVVVDDSGVVDHAKTQQRRAEIRDERSHWHRPAAVLDTPEPRSGHPQGQQSRPVHAYLDVIDGDETRMLACSVCGIWVAPYDANYKSGLLYNETAVTEIPTVGDAGFFLDDPIVFRRYCCPGCQVLMSAEVVKADEPLLSEVIFSP